jgi:hypothetical protein
VRIIVPAPTEWYDPIITLWLRAALRRHLPPFHLLRVVDRLSPIGLGDVALYLHNALPSYLTIPSAVLTRDVNRYTPSVQV